MRDLTYLEKYRLRDFERQYYGANGDKHNGVFRVFVQGKAFNVVVSDGGGWEHVSVSPTNRKRPTCPTWEEMCEIKQMFFEDEETVVEYHPKKSDYVNLCNNCLHLWRPLNEKLPTPPRLYV